MSWHKGRITHQEAVVAEADIWFETRLEPNGLLYWKESFALPVGPMLISGQTPGHNFRMFLDDGRSGEILVTQEQIDSDQRGAIRTIRFQRTGPRESVSGK